MRVIAAALLSLSLLVPAPLLACSCAPPPPPKEALAASTAVFTGKVVEVAKDGPFQLAVTLEVASSWKGVDGKKVTLYTANNGAACGVGFKKGASYLVYATKQKRGEEMVLSTNLCSRTTSLDSAKADLEELGEGKAVK